MASADLEFAAEIEFNIRYQGILVTRMNLTGWIPANGMDSHVSSLTGSPDLVKLEPILTTGILFLADLKSALRAPKRFYAAAAATSVKPH